MLVSGNRVFRKTITSLVRAGRYAIGITGNKSSGFSLVAVRGTNRVPISRPFNMERQARSFSEDRFGRKATKLRG